MARPLGLFATDRPPGPLASFLSRRAPRTRTRLLTGLFFKRFLDNDLVAPTGDMHAGMAFALALLVAPGVFNLAWLLFTYSGPFQTPSERLLLALDHKYQFLACSMIVTALGAVLQWDALSIDARDVAILGPLPVPHTVVWRAKVMALLLFVALFAVAVNLIPTIGFPAIWLSLVPIGFPRAISVVGAQALTSLAAAVFGFCAILAVRSLLRLACGPRVFRAASTVAQFLFALALIVAFLLLPAYSSNVRAQLRNRSAAVMVSPPMWFVGLNEMLTARALYADPDLTRDSTWKFWERERITYMYSFRKFPGLLPEAWVHPSPLFLTEEAARKRYRELQPVLDELAGVGIIAIGAGALVAAGLYFLAHIRGSRSKDAPFAAGPLRSQIRLTPDPTRPGDLTTLRRPAWPGLLIPRHGVARATFFFTVHALRRSPAHRVYVAASMAVALALVVVVVAPLAAAGTGLTTPTPMLLAQQFVLAFFLLTGVRAAFTVPATLEANWLFRATEGGDLAASLSGVRRALALRVALPLFLLLAPLHGLLWGARVATLHFVAGLLCSGLLVEVLLFGDRKIPFASASVPGKANVKTRWPLYVLGLAVFTLGFATLEWMALSDLHACAAFLACGICAVTVLGAVNRRRLAGRGLLFDEGPDPAVQTLGLG